MSFQALARTWRPRRFTELVGQAHVVRALTHALDHNQLHHALLFSGTRGVGKTTLARIIAKCLNCEHGVSARPCVGDEACATCREIDEARFVDLIEVDAASRTGVDDTRELMDNVQYAPTRGATKVYLIDEVHMLTKHSFNALLKTLEEPPPRVQFLFATTEPEKIPVTVLSRCLQFPLKRLPAARIAEQLVHVAAVESLTADEDALNEIARAADGSMRDGLSLLDQAIAFGGGRVSGDDVREMLGTIGAVRVAELVDAIIGARAGDAIAALEALYSQGIDMRYLLDALATAWQHIAAIQIVGAAADETARAWHESADRADPAAVQLFYDITLGGIRDFAHAPDPLVGVKMTVLRMLAFVPVTSDIDTPPDNPGRQQSSSHETARSGLAHMRAQLKTRASLAPMPALAYDTPPVQPAPVAQPAAEPRPAPAKPRALDSEDEGGREKTKDPVTPARGAAEDGPPRADSGPLAADPTEDWHALVKRLAVSGFAAQLAHNGAFRRLAAEHIELEIARDKAFLATENARGVLETALARLWQPAAGPRLAIKVVAEVPDTLAREAEQNAAARQREAVASIENDPIVKQLRDQLGACLRPETIKSHRPQAMSTPAAQQRDE